MNNASSLARVIKEKSIELASQASDLEAKRQNRELKEGEIQKKN